MNLDISSMWTSLFNFVLKHLTGMNIKTRMKAYLSSICTSVLSIEVDENEDRDGIIFYHPYGRQCFPLTWMNIKRGM